MAKRDTEFFINLPGGWGLLETSHESFARKCLSCLGPTQIIFEGGSNAIAVIILAREPVTLNAEQTMKPLFSTQNLEYKECPL